MTINMALIGAGGMGKRHANGYLELKKYFSDLNIVAVAPSEYAALADKYARTNRLGRYSVIPISGASEGFVPEDAEILIEGTETGATLAANNLSMIDVMIWSTNCIIGRKGGYPDRQQTMINSILDKF